MSLNLLEDYISFPDEFAAALGVHPRTVERWVRDLAGPPITRIGRARYVHKEAAAKWIRSREHQRVAV